MDLPSALDPTKFEHFWQADVTDDLIPSPGFLSDFVLALRGTEAPTVFCLWAGLWAISSLLKRETWYDWFPEPLYPNLYVILVSPPRLCAKSTVARWAAKVAEQAVGAFPDPMMREIKRLNLLRSKASPESLSMILEPTKKNVKDEKDDYHSVGRYPQIAMMLSELTTFLGRQKYNVGLIDRLTDLFDCAESDDLTISRGYKAFKDAYVTLLGGTTPDKLRVSIPDEAFGGGFMSRAIVVWKERSERMFPEPRNVPPWSMQEWRKLLGDRLAWVVDNAQGPYMMDDAAKDMYYKWYPQFHADLQKEGSEKRMEMQVRLDSHLIKVALLLRAQRYEPGRLITLHDLEEAKFLLNATFKANENATEDVGVSGYTRHLNAMRRLFKRRLKLTRRQLVQLMSPRDCDAITVSKIVFQMMQSGELSIRLNGEEKKSVSTNGHEVYFWRGA